MANTLQFIIEDMVITMFIMTFRFKSDTEILYYCFHSSVCGLMCF